MQEGVAAVAQGDVDITALPGAFEATAAGALLHAMEDEMKEVWVAQGTVHAPGCMQTHECHAAGAGFEVHARA